MDKVPKTQKTENIIPHLLDIETNVNNHNDFNVFRFFVESGFLNQQNENLNIIKIRLIPQFLQMIRIHRILIDKKEYLWQNIVYLIYFILVLYFLSDQMEDVTGPAVSQIRHGVGFTN